MFKNLNNVDLKKTAQGYKCGECDFKGKNNASLKTY